MAPETNETIYRFRTFSRRDNLPSKYQGSAELVDDSSHLTMAACDLCGRAAFSTVVITDHLDQIWTMRPNRAIMPTRWILVDQDQCIASQFDQALLGKLVNPIHKVALLILDGQDREVYRLVDPRTSVPDRILGVGPDEWLLLAGETQVARLAHLPSRKTPPKGIFGRISSFFTSADRGYITSTAPPPLQAPEVLAMLLLVGELTNQN